MKLRIHAVIGIWHGVLNSCLLTSDVDKAYIERDRLDVELGIERNEDGNYDSENDSIIFTQIVNY